ncbi:MAG: tetratricopeptide repeat protein [Woeseia sp.]
MAERRIQLSVAAVALASMLVAGCTTLPQAGGPADPAPRPPDAPRDEPSMRPVSESLLQQSRELRLSGDYAQAAATLERAVRIDPGAAAIWLELARVRYAENNWSQAEQLARKADSLARSDSAVKADALEVISDALRMQGRSQEAEAVLERLQR